eukprot:m.489313 g.489313  ORF g.489313 m.489313 type:complete len:519 (+) comp26601_c0_seq1:291-1847(+)
MATATNKAVPTMRLKTMSWNIAAVNNNPFEYYVTSDDAEYLKLMQSVEQFLSDPGQGDIAVEQVFTGEMWMTLRGRLEQAGVGAEHLPFVDEMWEGDLKQRTIVAGFLKDSGLGAKRLISMPDRVTNTIRVTPASSSPASEPDLACRPTVINMYEGDLGSTEAWFGAWLEFMFNKEFHLAGQSGGATQRAVDLLVPISKAKYPAVSEQEEAASLPLQVLCQAIFDAVMVHTLNTLSSTWQHTKRVLAAALCRNKNARIVEILETSYGDCDVMFLQETAAAFPALLKQTSLAQSFHIIGVDGARRDQNSMVLLSKASFPGGVDSACTGDVCKALPPKLVQVGDLLALEAKHTSGQALMLASFHGDTNGLATIPVLTALTDAAKASQSRPLLVFGLDANAYSIGKPGKQLGADELHAHCGTVGLTSCFGDAVHAGPTTCNARTFLQPQLNKACRSDQVVDKGDTNPKDFVLFSKGGWDCTEVAKDNTGKRGEFLDNTVFPTLDFPSDHAVLFAQLEPTAS